MSTATTTKSRLALELQPPVARIRIQNPPLNIIDLPMMDELASALAEIETLPGITVIILSGTQKAFSVGVDVAAHTPDKVESMLTKFHGVIRALVASKKVSIAAVH